MKTPRPSTPSAECSINRYYTPTTDQFLSVDPDLAETGQPYAFADDDPTNTIDPDGLCSIFGSCWSEAAHDVAHAATDVGHYVASHKKAIAEIAIGVVAVAAATVLTAGVGDALLAAGAAAAEEASEAAAEGDLLGSLESADLAIHAPFVLAPGLAVGLIGGAMVYEGIQTIIRSGGQVVTSSGAYGQSVGRAC